MFNGFFNVDEWKFRIKNEYNVYCENMLDILPIGAVKYIYVQVDYDKSKGSVNNQYNGDDKNIVIDILNEIKEDNSKLIIIEAPAGFGKTCTSYEIINKMVQESDLPLPFFTEFSRDRQAKVFSHVFVREVDRSFRTVNIDLVIEETKNGRIVLVLDGFDELLNESMTDVDDGAGFEKTQPMLETIGDLLNKKSKVILTSRRTAIFDGEAFQDWVDDYKYDFETIRYRLNIPKVTDWSTPAKRPVSRETLQTLVRNRGTSSSVWALRDDINMRYSATSMMATNVRFNQSAGSQWASLTPCGAVTAPAAASAMAPL